MKQLSLAIFVLLTMTTILQAEEKFVKIINNYWQPYYGEELPYNGIVGEIITRIFKRQGYSVEYLTTSWKASLYHVKNLGRDCVATAYYTEERAKTYYYSDPYMESPTGFFVRKESNIKWEVLEDLKPYKIGTVVDNAYSPEFDKAKFLLKEPVLHEKLNLRKLIKKRIDITVLDKFVGFYLLKNEIKESGNQIIFLEPPLKTQKLYLMFCKKNSTAQKKIKAFNDGLKQASSDGSINRILNKYGMGTICNVRK